MKKTCEWLRKICRFAMTVEEARRIMEVGPNYSPSEIKKKYRELALKLHPDKNKSPNANEQMARLNSAYLVLKDPSKAVSEQPQGSPNPWGLNEEDLWAVWNLDEDQWEEYNRRRTEQEEREYSQEQTKPYTGEVFRNPRPDSEGRYWVRIEKGDDYEIIKMRPQEVIDYFDKIDAEAGWGYDPVDKTASIEQQLRTVFFNHQHDFVMPKESNLVPRGDLLLI